MVYYYLLYLYIDLYNSIHLDIALSTARTQRNQLSFRLKTLKLEL